ncbi:hypothetical protein FB446DRAFT_795229, partial [Lentinula raphanica]
MGSHKPPRKPNCTNAFTITAFSLRERIARAEQEHRLLDLDYVDNPTTSEFDYDSDGSPSDSDGGSVSEDPSHSFCFSAAPDTTELLRGTQTASTGSSSSLPKSKRNKAARAAPRKPKWVRPPLPADRERSPTPPPPLGRRHGQ